VARCLASAACVPLDCDAQAQPLGDSQEGRHDDNSLKDQGQDRNGARCQSYPNQNQEQDAANSRQHAEDNHQCAAAQAMTGSVGLGMVKIVPGGSLGIKGAAESGLVRFSGTPAL
jgi:hypothetical protein